jgi:UDP-glucose 4-epimerase
VQTPITTVLVTGASGFIGRSLVQRLLGRRCRVHTLSRQAPEQDLEQGPDGSECLSFQGDICDPTVLDKACAGVDIIFHLAAYAHVNQHDTAAMRATNVDGTQALLDAALRARVRRVVFFSSSLADATKYPQLTDYGRAKRDAEQLLLRAAEAGDIEVCCLRPVSVYGLGMKGNLLSMIRLLQKGLLPPLPVPSASLSLVGCRDLCAAALLAAEAPQANGQIYTVTDGKTYTVKGLEISIRQALGRALPRWHTPLPLLRLAFTALALAARVLPLRNAPGLRTYRTLTTDSVFSCEPIQQALGYHPTSTFTQELPTLLDPPAAAPDR